MSLLGKIRGRRKLPDSGEEWVGWLEPGVEMEGSLKAPSGMIQLNCHFKGDIHTEGTVIIEDQGEVEGEIHTKLLCITGKVKGTIHTSERLEIKEKGIVLGEIYTPCLLVDPGGFLDGSCHMPLPGPSAQLQPDLDTEKGQANERP
jgi:cytoskeletal protein CcmA (bactofilin family)